MLTPECLLRNGVVMFEASDSSKYMVIRKSALDTLSWGKECNDELRGRRLDFELRRSTR